jgi:endonuclease/exonuclease/phosphatase family metal-dependent hydrolase
MTYNVHGFMNIKFVNKFENIVEIIKLVDPDVLVLEEVYIYNKKRICTTEQLVEQMEKIGLIYNLFSNGINAIFSKYEINGYPFNLGKDPIRGVNRSAIICRIKDFLVIGTHLDVFDESGKTRKEQMNLILQTIKKYQKEDYENYRIIITGDFNSLKKSDYNTNEWKNIIDEDKKRNVDTVEDVVPLLEKSNYIDSFDHCKKSIKVSVWSNRRVDYIFGKNIDFVNSYVYKSTVSDHYPIYADF